MIPAAGNRKTSKKQQELVMGKSRMTSAQGFLLLACGICLVGLGVAREIPDYIHICKRSDPRVAKCIRESVEVLRPRLKTGIPELSVPPLEPLYIDEIEIFPNNEGSNLKAYLRNIKVHEVGDFEVTKLKVNVDKMTYRVGVRLPHISVDGDYDVNVRVLVVPIKGNGKFYANITDAEGQGVLRAELIEKEGHKEIRFTNFDFAIRISDYNIHLENLFNGDPILSQAANEVLNSNKQEFMQAAMPFIQRKASEILLEAAKKITEGLDYDKVFPK